MGASAGIDLAVTRVGGEVGGRFPAAALMAAWTSRAAALMSRLRSNCRTTLADPTELKDVISVTPAIRVNCFSSGVATEAAITSGLPPGKPAFTKIVG